MADYVIDTNQEISKIKDDIISLLKEWKWDKYDE